MPAMPPRLDLALLPGTFAVCRLDPAAPVPGWAGGPGELASVTRTGAELSIVCPDARVPPAIRAERGWRCLRVAGPLDFSLVGVLAALAGALAGAGVSLFALSTFDTDHLLVREADLDRALRALEEAGHGVAR